MGTKDTEIRNTLDTHEERIRELEEENRHLRLAAEQFGQLAERLNRQLIEERRKGGDRRRMARSGPDRRRLPGSDET